MFFLIFWATYLFNLVGKTNCLILKHTRVLLEAKNKYYFTFFLSATNRVGPHIAQKSHHPQRSIFVLKLGSFGKVSNGLIKQFSVSGFQVLSSSLLSTWLYFDKMNNCKKGIKISAFHSFKGTTFQVSTSKAASCSQPPLQILVVNNLHEYIWTWCLRGE